MSKQKPKEHDIPLWMKELHVVDGKIDCILKGKQATQAMVGMFGDMFEECGGINFVSLRLFHPKHGPMEMVLRREAGKTPYDVAVEMLRRIQELEGMLRVAHDAVLAHDSTDEETNEFYYLRLSIRNMLDRGICKTCNGTHRVQGDFPLEALVECPDCCTKERSPE